MFSRISSALLGALMAAAAPVAKIVELPRSREPRVIDLLEPVKQHRNPDHPRQDRRRSGLTPRQYRREIRAINRAL